MGGGTRVMLLFHRAKLGAERRLGVRWMRLVRPAVGGVRGVQSAAMTTTKEKEGQETETLEEIIGYLILKIIAGRR